MGKRFALEHLSIFEYKLEGIKLSKHYMMRLVNIIYLGSNQQVLFSKLKEY